MSDGYKVGVDLAGEGAESFTAEVFNLELKITNETFTTLFERKQVSVEIEFFWDSHGRRIPWSIEIDGKDKASYNRTKADVKIIKNNYTMMNKQWESWKVEVTTAKDGLKKFEADSYSYNGKTNVLRIKSTVGWG